MKVVWSHFVSINNNPLQESYKEVNCEKCNKSLLDTKPIELTTNNFDEVIANSDIPVVVDFWAPWCGPCKMVGPAFAEAAKGYPLKVRFAKLNTEEHQAPSAKFGIRSIPTMIAFKTGKELDRVSGALSVAQIKQWVSKLI